MFCPTLNTANVLTHVLKKESPITFIQQIGGGNNKYQNSIGMNGQNVFALSIPNLVIKFDYDIKTESRVNRNEPASISKTIIPGNISLKLVDYKNTMHELIYQYEFDISAEVIKYREEQSDSLYISSANPIAVYSLQTHLIKGPVMDVSLDVDTCEFLTKSVEFVDVFRKTKCLINIDSKKFGNLLDLISINLDIGRSVEIIITSRYFICVENREIVITQNLSISKACTILGYDKNRGIFICDEGQGSVIKTFSFTNSSCEGLGSIEQIAKPSWLIYQYFRMKFKEKYAIFEIPIRVESNKIYFLTTYNSETD